MAGRAISFSVLVYLPVPRAPGSFPPCPGSMTILFIPNSLFWHTIFEFREKIVRNPKTNEKILKKKSYKLHFKIGKILHKKINNLDNSVSKDEI